MCFDFLMLTTTYGQQRHTTPYSVHPGKSSLCKALAHKLSVRLSSRYSSGHLIEVNAHSLFSRWFSESGKLVLKLFTTVKEMLEDNRSFVCVLVDEVESVSAARSDTFSGSDPSDALRVVNALLTQLDTLRSYPNALVLTTSNLTEKIDPAFLDRADIKQYIPNPSRHCRYEILKECVEELVRHQSVFLVASYKSVDSLNRSTSNSYPVSPSVLCVDVEHRLKCTAV
ncbi:UNVERIFIED_CONTAM: hypothetical protein H355_011111 [Colinus virginianus]|nr:hypothetical protein H355_011111 [Colinus virginianus]